MAGLPIGLLILGLMYVVLGMVAIHAWRWQLRRRHGPVALHANPYAWLSFWLPQVIVAEVFALTAGSVAVLLALAFTTISSSERPYINLGIGCGIVGMAVLFAVIDGVMVVRARQMARQRRAQGDEHPR